MSRILRISLRKILDSRGNPTLESEVTCERGWGRASAPSGASTGKREVPMWPEGGIDRALEVGRREVVPSLLGREVGDLEGIDRALEEIDGTGEFRRIGGSLAVSLSLACAKARAESLGVPLWRSLSSTFSPPRPVGNVLGGGAHAVGGTEIQEFLVSAEGRTLAESVFLNAEIHSTLKKILQRELPGKPLGKGDEGGWVAPLADERALELVWEASEEVSRRRGVRVGVGLDLASSEVYDGERGTYSWRSGERSSGEQVEFILDLVRRFPLFYVEDPLSEDDWEGWKDLTRRVPAGTLLVGDDIFVTREDLVDRGIQERVAHAVLVKPNQVGTLTRARRTVERAHRAGYRTILSHRSGETTDEALAHLAVGLGSFGIKTGVVGGERISKLNELIRIEEGFLEEVKIP